MKIYLILRNVTSGDKESPIIAGFHASLILTNIQVVEISGTFIKLSMGLKIGFSINHGYFENITTFDSLPFIIIEDYLPIIQNVTFVNADIGSTLIYFLRNGGIAIQESSFKKDRKSVV